jgi:hypothetical protein
MDRLKTAHANARPPQWAEVILQLLLKPEDRESVSGDLLEEYRDTMVPVLGSGAGRWVYMAGGAFLLRASWAWGAVLGAPLVIRTCSTRLFL